jgi:hypothetical protein
MVISFEDAFPAVTIYRVSSASSALVTLKMQRHRISEGLQSRSDVHPITERIPRADHHIHGMLPYAELDMAALGNAELAFFTLASTAQRTASTAPPTSASTLSPAVCCGPRSSQ